MKNFCRALFTLFAVPIFIGISTLSICKAQTAPPIQWQNNIGGTLLDQITSISQATDGGYLLGGRSDSNISGDKTEDCIGGYDDYWIVKLDSIGNIQWQNTIGGTMTDALNAVQQTSDGGYILAGLSASNISSDKTENCIGAGDYWIVKVDSVGIIQWQNTIGGNEIDILNSVEQTADGGFIMGGNSNSNISGDKIENCIGISDFWIVKVDSVGNIQWQNTIGGSNAEDIFSIHQTSDKGYILGGASLSNISGDKTESNIGGWDYWILKLDSMGNIQWQNTIGGYGNDFLFSGQQTIDGGYILGGWSESDSSGDKSENSMGGDDYWIVKTDSNGIIQWENTIGGSGVDDLYSICQTDDGGYFIGGFSDSNISGDKTENSNGFEDYWIVKTDSNGNIIWQNSIGGSYTDALGPALQTSDGGFIMGGISNSNMSGDKTENCIGGFDYWIVKLAPDTITGIRPYPTLHNNEIVLFPNPFTDELSITINSLQEKAEIKIYDVYGRIIAEKSLSASDNIIQTSDFSRGVYFVEVITGNQKSVSKVVKQ